LIAVRTEGAQLTSADGETTSHIMGTFYRTIRMVDNGIKPVYVFDGKVYSATTIDAAQCDQFWPD
jgi:flap endonuclease-1